MRAASLRIPTPCAQPWHEMTPQGAGRHCASCQKVVIDFARKTDAEILAILAAGSGEMCGRFAVSQLERPLQAFEAPGRPSRWSTMVAASVALLGLRELAAPAEARAQQPTTQQPSPPKAPEPDFFIPTSAPVPGKLLGEPVQLTTVAPLGSPDHQLCGQVVDSKGVPLPGVTVLLQGTQHGASSREDGRFALPVAPEEQHLTLVVSSIGFVTATVPQPAGSQLLRVVLQEDTKMLGGLIVASFYPPIYTPRGLWGRLRSIPYRFRELLR